MRRAETYDGKFVGNLYGAGSGPILFNNVRCTGAEADITACQQDVNDQGCGHDDDVSVSCTAGIITHRRNFHEVLLIVLHFKAAFVIFSEINSLHYTLQVNTIIHRRSQGVHWVHVHPRAEIKSGPNLQGKVVSAPRGRECTPEAEQESNFVRKLGRSGRVFFFRATTKKRSSVFEKE